ncbi:hypothetical protein [Variovorax sp. YR566]
MSVGNPEAIAHATIQTLHALCRRLELSVDLPSFTARIEQQSDRMFATWT